MKEALKKLSKYEPHGTSNQSWRHYLKNLEFVFSDSEQSKKRDAERKKKSSPPRE